MAYETLLVEKLGATTTVTLNRPAKLNAMNGQMLAEFDQLFTELRTDLETRFVIFTGAGRAFTSGADLRDLVVPTEGPVPPHARARLGQLGGQDFIRSLESLEQITIAAVNGFALGAGLVLAMGCDFRIASENASFGIPETNVGLFFTWGCTPRLTRLIGPAKAKEMILTCDVIGAEEALAIGLVNKVVPRERLMEAAHELIDKIASRAPLAIRMTKKLVNAAAAPNFGDLYICEPELVERLFLSPDLTEGMRAFIEKRKPNFTER
ncbi:MAG: enoyl-CoA hydratase/isomerase family protein [Dehalococcoidia bacterium]|nr:enoyl-CoA hydratase/isomerase family protein [Dehalococcoidia bacterium]